MALSNEQVKELIKAPKNGLKLQKAIHHELRLSFHSTIVDKKDDANGYLKDFMLWVKSIVTATDKYAQFEKLLTFPVATNALIDEISDEYVKVFDAQNSLMDYTFTDSKYKELFDEFLQQNNDEHFWKRDVFGAIFSAINSIVVVDLPQIQTTDYPVPYYYLLPIDQVIDLDYDSINKRLNYVIFHSKGNIAAFDNLSYRLFQTGANGEFIQIVNEPHDLGYCPANFMWRDNIDPNDFYNKQSPLSSQLGDLDWYLFYSTIKKSLDLYASYPIYWAYEGKCNYRNPQGAECEGGFTHYTDGEGNSKPVACPSCEAKKLVGPGSLLSVPIPRNSNEPDLREPVGVVSVDSGSLQYNVDELERLENDIKQKATGKIDSKLLSKEALNEDQVRSQFESQTNILRYIASNLDAIRSWTMDTVGKLMFGEIFVSSSINHGTEFYLQSLDELTKEYNAAKTAGLPLFILASKRKMLAELQAKNNPSERDNMEVLRYLEPYPDLTISDCKNYGVMEADPEGYAVKLNFSYLIDKFELEFGSIVEFGYALPLKTKIERINEKLKDYVKITIKSSTGSGTKPGEQQPGTGK
ncbi:hypothetical protein BWD42_04095 [Sphingobacterium sp. CZ-UAM]|uniref:hypothetical protein n=1 Tax=Sphingobacterium sp. CZ-UAM TaxID=1933868 RepID=UPI000985BF3A|nr:hypothetical protein [Sphingobacterium sp. CZ-UAM]OOG19139.1 hypothetical protein BWD42_04095 [Sphingobacterium sp. CZ-UAM]